RVSLFFVSYKNKLVAAFVTFTLFNLEPLNRSDQRGQLGEAVVSGVKVRLLLLKQVTHVTEKSPSFIISQVINRGCNQFKNSGRDFVCLVFFVVVCGYAWYFLFGPSVQDLYIDELVASYNKRFRGFLFSHSKYFHPCFPEPGSQAGKITIAGNQTESPDLAGIEDVHGVDNHSGVSCIFPGGVAILLDRGN